MSIFNARMVRELKGAPLACFILISIAGQPVTNDWLCRMSGYTDKPVAQALRLLSSPEYQLVRRSRGGWVLVDATQMVLAEPTEQPCLPESRNNSDSATALINLNTDSELKDKAAASRKNSDSDERYDANFEACKQAGIFNSAAEQISALEHVTPEFISAHVASLRKGEGRGLAVLRIKNNEKPAKWEQEEIKAENESSQKYVSGEYAGFVQH